MIFLVFTKSVNTILDNSSEFFYNIRISEFKFFALLINSDNEESIPVLEVIKTISGVKEVYRVYGAFDTIDRIEKESMNSLNETIKTEIRATISLLIVN
jgi:DNA-binding Lrp family transcriptional regulator